MIRDKTIFRRALAACLALGLFGTGTLLAGDAAPAGEAVTQERCRKAAAYSAKHRGISMVVMIDGEIVFEDYPNGGAKDRAQELASGTKSFAGVLAAAAVQDGLLDLDELVCETLGEWKADPRKSKVTVRQLLHLTSGVKTGGERGKLPTYAEALKIPFETEPGEAFKYGGVPFQIFGELMRRKLAGRKESPIDYLKRRLFEPIGLEVGAWRKDADGNPTLPSGARLTARNWAKFGEFVRLGGTWKGERILEKELLDACFEGSKANPCYGLTWWLNRACPQEIRRRIPQLRAGVDDLWPIDCIPKDMVMAMGAGKQHLYVSRERRLVAVRQASGIMETLRGESRPTFSEAVFLQLLFSGEAPEEATAEGDEEGNEAKARAEKLIRYLDKDGDGRLSPEEAPRRIQNFFDRVDASGDGYLDAAELGALLERLGGRGRR